MKKQISNNYGNITDYEKSITTGGGSRVSPWLLGLVPLLLNHWGDIKSGFKDGFNDFHKK